MAVLPPNLDTTHGLTFALEDLLFPFFSATSQLAIAVRLPRNHLPWSLSPLRRSHSRNPLPSLASLSRCHPHHLARLRRGVPIPLRSASAVSHDLDGFLLLEPCGIFHPLAPVGFDVPLSLPPLIHHHAQREWSFSTSPVERKYEDFHLPSVGVGT